jgi:hypothetical protein
LANLHGSDRDNRSSRTDDLWCSRHFWKLAEQILEEVLYLTDGVKEFFGCWRIVTKMPFGDTHSADINTAGDIKLRCAEHDLCRATADINNQMANWIKYKVADASLISQAALILTT